jgi:hypothetical protein
LRGRDKAGLGGAGGGVVAGEGEDGGDCLRGAGRDGGVEGDPVHIGVVEGLDVEGLVEGGLDGLGVQVHTVGQDGQGVEQAGVVVAGAVLVQCR